MIEAVIFFTFFLADVEPKSVTQGYFWNSEIPWTMEYCENYVLPEIEENLRNKSHIEVETLECVSREVKR